MRVNGYTSEMISTAIFVELTQQVVTSSFDLCNYDT